MNTVAIGQYTKAYTSKTTSRGTTSIDRELQDAKARIDKLEAAMALMQEQFEKVWYAPGMPGAAEAEEDFDSRTADQKWLDKKRKEAGVIV
jgi:hypothetical protein